jgi:hypothetical protein
MREGRGKKNETNRTKKLPPNTSRQERNAGALFPVFLTPDSFHESQATRMKENNSYFTIVDSIPCEDFRADLSYRIRLQKDE